MSNKPLYILQRRTRVTLMLCKMALREANDDIDLAEEVIREHLKGSALMIDSHWS